MAPRIHPDKLESISSARVLGLDVIVVWSLLKALDNLYEKYYE